MKKILFAAILVFSVFAYSASYAQDSTKAKSKNEKVMKKADKGKTHKAMKKDYKADKKEVKSK